MTLASESVRQKDPGLHPGVAVTPATRATAAAVMDETRMLID